jgi:hypothetical protein
MKEYDKNRFNRDETGQWWWHGTSNGKEYRLRTHVMTCEKCHKNFLVSANRKDRRYCSHVCSSRAFMDKNPTFFKRENSGHWKGGKTKRRGYVFIHNPEHPVCQGNKRKYVPEHRLVIEKHLGRFLQPFESVHHRNGRRDDNRLENLELWIKAHPYGTRVEDMPHCPTCTCGKH